MTLVRLGGALSFAGRTRQAVGAYDRALELMRQLDDEVGRARVLSRIGDAHARVGDFSKVIPLCEQTIAIFQDHQEIQDEGVVQSQLAHTLMSMYRLTEAEEAFRRAIELLRDAGDPMHTGIALHGLGLSLIKAGDPRSAVETLKQALQIVREIGQLHREATILGNLGMAHESFDEPARAIRFLEQAQKIGLEIGASDILSWVETALKRLRATP